MLAPLFNFFDQKLRGLPQLIEFYESNLRWKAADESAEVEMATNV